MTDALLMAIWRCGKPKALLHHSDHLPIPDVSVPDGQFERQWETAGKELLQTLKQGERIVVHCRGGLGRAGLVAARLLIETGFPADKAIRGVRAARPGAIETKEQEDYLRLL